MFVPRIIYSVIIYRCLTYLKICNELFIIVIGILVLIVILLLLCFDIDVILADVFIYVICLPVSYIGSCLLHDLNAHDLCYLRYFNSFSVYWWSIFTVCTGL